MSSQTPDKTAMAAQDTFPKLLAENAQKWPTQVAMREKRLGIWNDITWADYQQQVGLITLGLESLGIERGDVVGLIGDGRPAWIFGEVAAHALGALSIGFYQDALPHELVFLINVAQPKLIIAENEEQVDKLLEIGEECPCIRHIVYCHPRGMRKYDNPQLLSLQQLQQAGAERLRQAPGRYDQLVAAGKGSDVAILCPTAGTTGPPKLAMLQAGALLAHSRDYLKADPREVGDHYVSVLPLPWIMEQIYAVAQPLVARTIVHFVEKHETMMSDLREVGPHFLLLVPRVWEAIAADVHSRLMDTAPLKLKLYHIGMKLAWKAAIREGRQSALAGLLLTRSLRDRLGFSRLRSASTAGALLGPDTFRFFRAIGVPLRQLYGQTELGGAYTIHPQGDIDYESVGVPFSGAEVRIKDPDASGVGEIVARSAGMFAGYYNNDLANRRAVRDGWLETGDCGYIKPENGHLVVIDRLRDLGRTSSGVSFAHQSLENRLKFSAYLSEAVVIGHQRPYLTALLCIRYSYVAKWAESRTLSFTNYTNLAALPEVQQLIQGEVEAINAGLPEEQRIRRCLLLYKDFDPDDGEQTRTRTLRRGVIQEKYANLIEALYSEAQTIPVDTWIPFPDGSKAHIRTDLAIIDLPQTAAPLRRAQ